MGLFASRQNATVEETDVSLNHLYKYPPRSGNYFGTHFIMGGERFDTPQPEAYLFGENADLNFLGSKPTPFPYPPPQATEPTKTLKSLVNIRKESVRFVKVLDGGNSAKPIGCTAGSDGTGKTNPTNNGSITNGYNIEFIFDADSACQITIYYFCIEDIGPGGLNYISRDSSMTSETFHFQRGVNQLFSAPHHIIYPAMYAEDDLSYSPEKETFPVVIHCVVGEGNSTTLNNVGNNATNGANTTISSSVGTGGDGADGNGSRQSHATICVIDHHSDGTYALRALKQKIFVDGLYYLLQEIYGIENKLANKSVTDEETEDNGSECVICMCDTRDTLILPCRHLCLCNSCADSLRYQANNCPICRAPFRALLQIRAVQKDGGGGGPACGGSAPTAQNSADSADNIPAGYKTISLIEALNGPTVSVKAINGSNDSTAGTENGSENNRNTENGYAFRNKMTKSGTDHSSNGELANGSIVSEKSSSDIRMHLLASDETNAIAEAGTGGSIAGGIANPATVCTKKELLSKHSPLMQRAPVSKDKNPREKGSLHRTGNSTGNASNGNSCLVLGKTKSPSDRSIGFHLVHEKPAPIAVGVPGGKMADAKLTELAENDDDSEAEKLSPLLRKSDSYDAGKKLSTHGDSAMKKLLIGGTGTVGVELNEKTSPSAVITELLKGAIIGSDDIGGDGNTEVALVGGTRGTGIGGGVGAGGAIISIVTDDSEDYYTPEDPPATSPLKSIDDDDELPKLAEIDTGRKLLVGSVTAAPVSAPPAALSVLKEEFSQGSLPDSPISGNSQTSTRSSSDSYSSSSSTRQLLSSGAVPNDTPTHVLSSCDSTANGHNSVSKVAECGIESD
ncbi:E3 ubiquitin ligase RNF157 [Anopheles marshallii]|uniref:E3 ubiquitin ligase RNF157 n=1 Tax=Anopheles marshallii TaxID=1521116 RepID=UPI00237ADB1F|nr:E3 ubiquitin ligase RNF157 [Anopheles marshallii]